MAMQPGGYLDRPEDDLTKNAHPAFTRGRTKGTLDVLNIIKEIITGNDPGEGTINATEIEKVRRAVFILKEGLLTCARTRNSDDAKIAEEALDSAINIVNSSAFKKTS